jgi:hypothetical protein
VDGDIGEEISTKVRPIACETVSLMGTWTTKNAEINAQESLIRPDSLTGGALTGVDLVLLRND